jgi:tight adherence protein C
MPYIIALSAFGTVFYLVSWLSRLALRDMIKIRIRVGQVRNFTGAQDPLDELALPFVDRTIKPILDGLSRTLGKFAPDYYREKIKNRLIAAGNPGGLNVDRFMAALGAAAIVPALLYLLAGILGRKSLGNTIALALILALLGPLILNLVLVQLVKKRKLEIQRSLPDALDLITVSVEAGLAFDSALARVAEKMPGPLSRELSRLLQEIRMGKMRKEALKDMVERTQVEDFSSVIGAILQADQLGVGIAQVLRVQSDFMREKRKQRAQETAMKAPIKMLFPLAFFIFPTLFIVILGPAFIQIMKVLIPQMR